MKTWHKIIIIIVILAATSALSVGVLAFLENSRPAPSTQNSEPDGTSSEPAHGFVIDTSKDYGACSLVSRDTVARAIGPLASSLQDSVNLGRIAPSQGEKGRVAPADTQSCVFAFITGGSLDNIYNSHNGLVVSVGVYVSLDEAAQAAQAPQNDPSLRAIDALGDAAYLSGPTPSSIDTKALSLTVIRDTSYYQLRLSLPIENAPLSDAQIEAALIAIARNSL